MNKMTSNNILMNMIPSYSFHKSKCLNTILNMSRGDSIKIKMILFQAINKHSIFLRELMRIYFPK